MPDPVTTSRRSATRPRRKPAAVRASSPCLYAQGSPVFARVYLVPGPGDAHATWNTTGVPTVLVLSLVTLNGHRCPTTRYAPSGGATGLGATGRAPWPTALAITEAMAATIRHPSRTPETQRRRAGRLAPNCTRSSGPPPRRVMADDCTSLAAVARAWPARSRDRLISRIPALPMRPGR